MEKKNIVKVCNEILGNINNLVLINREKEDIVTKSISEEFNFKRVLKNSDNKEKFQQHEKEFKDREKSIRTYTKRLEEKIEKIREDGTLDDFVKEAKMVREYIEGLDEQTLLLEEFLVQLERLKMDEEKGDTIACTRRTRYLFYPLRRVVHREYQMDAKWQDFLHLHRAIVENKSKNREEQRDVRSMIVAWNRMMPDLIVEDDEGNERKIRTKRERKSA